MARALGGLASAAVSARVLTPEDALKCAERHKSGVLSFEHALDGPFREAMADLDASAWRPFLRELDGDAPPP